jgi:hypothetical protein
MGDDMSRPQPIDVPEDHDGQQPTETDDLDAPIDPVDPIKRDDDDRAERQPGLDPTPPPIAPD